MKYEYKTHTTYRGYGWIEPLTDSEDSLIEGYLARRICEELNALQAENERLRQDAQRYRWLREHGRYSGKVLVDHADMGRVLRIEKQLDEIIDAEMQRSNEEVSGDE